MQHSGGGGGGGDGRLPVFIFPQTLSFYTGDASTHKQILTLYNPYDFHISYTVLCNNPSCYTVEPPKGVVRPKCSLDMIVTRTTMAPAPSSSLGPAQATPAIISDRDRFRVLISEEGARMHSFGKKDIPATLVSGAPPDPRAAPDTDLFESVRAPPPSRPGSTPHPGPTPNPNPFASSNGVRGPSLVLVGAAVVCLGGLLLPTQGEPTPSPVPPFLHLNANMKIVIAYALGLLTYAILRPL